MKTSWIHGSCLIILINTSPRSALRSTLARHEPWRLLSELTLNVYKWMINEWIDGWIVMHKQMKKQTNRYVKMTDRGGDRENRYEYEHGIYIYNIYYIYRDMYVRLLVDNHVQVADNLARGT